MKGAAATSPPPPLRIGLVAIGIAILALLVALLVTQMEPEPTWRAPATDEERRIVEMANSYVAKRWPDHSDLERPAVIRYSRGYWKVTYPFLRPMSGGTAEITIDATTRTITSASHSQ